MNMNIEDKTIIFNNDDELTKYCLCSEPTMYTDDELGIPCYDYMFTNDYLDAVRSDYRFKVLDPNSNIMKRGCVCKGIITKPLQNLCEN